MPRGQRRPAATATRPDSRIYSWDELVVLVAAGYDPEVNWRFAHLTPEQIGTMKRQAKKVAA